MNATRRSRNQSTYGFLASAKGQQQQRSGLLPRGQSNFTSRDASGMQLTQQRLQHSTEQWSSSLFQSKIQHNQDSSTKSFASEGQQRRYFMTVKVPSVSSSKKPRMNETSEAKSRGANVGPRPRPAQHSPTLKLASSQNLTLGKKQPEPVIDLKRRQVTRLTKSPPGKYTLKSKIVLNGGRQKSVSNAEKKQQLRLQVSRERKITSPKPLRVVKISKRDDSVHGKSPRRNVALLAKSLIEEGGTRPEQSVKQARGAEKLPKKRSSLLKAISVLQALDQKTGGHSRQAKIDRQFFATDQPTETPSNRPSSPCFQKLDLDNLSSSSQDRIGRFFNKDVNSVSGSSPTKSILKKPSPLLGSRGHHSSVRETFATFSSMTKSNLRRSQTQYQKAEGPVVRAPRQSFDSVQSLRELRHSQRSSSIFLSQGYVQKLQTKAAQQRLVTVSVNPAPFEEAKSVSSDALDQDESPINESRPSSAEPQQQRPPRPRKSSKRVRFVLESSDQNELTEEDESSCCISCLEFDEGENPQLAFSNFKAHPGKLQAFS